MSSVEKTGGRNFGLPSHLDFFDFVHSNALIDLGFVGNKFTWSNNWSGGDNIRERLDCGLANQGWAHLYPNSLLNHLWASHSDHCPLLLSTSGSYQNLPKLFHFEAFWTRDLANHSLVAEAWLSEVAGSPAFSLSRKWKNTKNALKFWNSYYFGHIESKIKSLKSEINAIQACPYSLINSAKEVSLQSDLREQLLREEILWKQKSRELWLTSTACRIRYNSISYSRHMILFFWEEIILVLIWLIIFPLFFLLRIHLLILVCLIWWIVLSLMLKMITYALFLMKVRFLQPFLI
jgi:hypothetical protein